MNKERDGCNGWTNYATWNVKLWIDNDEATQKAWERKALQAKDAYSLSQELKDKIMENAPELGASMYSDILGAALLSVDWHEIAEAMIEDSEDK